MRRMQRRRVAAEPSEDLDGQPRVRRLVDGRLTEMVEDIKEAKFYFHNPLFKQLLRVPPDHVVDRTIGAISNINLMAALLLSGVMSAAQEPFDPALVPEDRRIFANLFNICATVAMTINIATVTFTTYMLLALASEVPSTIYRSLSRLQWTSFSYFAATFLSFFLQITLAVLAQYTKGDLWAARVCLILASSLGFLALPHFFWMLARVWPNTYSGWGMFWPFFWTKKVKADAIKTGLLMSTEARGHIQVRASEDSKGEGEEDSARVEPVVLRLEKVLQRAIPALQEDRVRYLALTMFHEGLDVPILVKVASSDARLLYEVLENSEDVNFELRRGERLQLLATLQQIAADPVAGVEGKGGGLGQDKDFMNAARKVGRTFSDEMSTKSLLREGALLGVGSSSGMYGTQEGGFGRATSGSMGAT